LRHRQGKLLLHRQRKELVRLLKDPINYPGRNAVPRDVEEARIRASKPQLSRHAAAINGTATQAGDVNNG
jgi:hypothetical protein